MGTRSWPAALALLAMLLVLVMDTSAPARSAERSHLFLVVLENHEYDEVVGNPDAPFLNGFARRETVAAYYYAIAHPSLPNYLAMLGGSTYGLTTNCTACAARGPNLALQLSRAHVSWRAYMGGMPRRCFHGAESGTYVKRHNPFMYFPSISTKRNLCRRVVPARRLNADLRRHSLPAFGWLSPDLCRDGHDCGIATSDRYLAGLVPRIMRQLGPRGVLVVTFDEGSSDEACCRPFKSGGGGHVLTVIARPGEPVGHRTVWVYSHYSLLAGIERRFALPHLNAARHARPLPLGTLHR